MTTPRCLLLLACATALAAAQTPQFLHAQMETQAANQIEAQLHAAEAAAATPVWWGYSVAGMPRSPQQCGVIHLDGGSFQSSDKLSPPVAAPLVILFRLADHTVSKVRFFSDNCQIDAGGARVIWLTGAHGAQNAALLAGLARAGGNDGADGAMAALAESAGTEAETALESLTAASAPEKTREQAVFWLGSARGHAGFVALQRLARQGGNAALDRKVAFGLYVSHDPEAVPELIRMAKLAAAPEVREQAIFWLSQKASRLAVGAISDAAANDPSTKVKERAVFGLSQLPHDQGVPLLIQVAKSNPNPAVRKRAMFWLGQSHDPRALAYFSSILAR